MRHTRVGLHGSARLLVMAAAVIASGSLPAQTVPDDFQIKLERTQCFGECPIYSVVIDGAGNITYEGRQHVRIEGRQTDRVPISQVAALAATVDRIGFFQMRDQYRTVRLANGTESVITDLPSTFVTVTSGGRTKRIEDYYDAPAELHELEKQIEETARTTRWTRIDEMMLKELVDSGRAPSAGERIELLKTSLTYDDVGVVKMLLEMGTNPNTMVLGVHPLMMARSGAAVRSLLAAGADPNVESRGGQTALGRASHLEPDITQALLQAGATPDKQDSEGRTALWLAAAWGNYEVVNLILSAGADPTFVSRNGRSVLEVATEGGARAGLERHQANVFRRNWPFDYEDFERTIALVQAAIARRKPR